MNRDKAITLINGTTFKPGWRFTAGPGDTYTEVEVTYHVDTMDTSLPDAMGRYEVPKLLESEVTFDVSRLAEGEVLYRLLLMAAELDSHENREFLRVRDENGNWMAPFHPHTGIGEASFEAAKELAAREEYARLARR